jgi:hypothetical protein
MNCCCCCCEREKICGLHLNQSKLERNNITLHFNYSQHTHSHPHLVRILNETARAAGEGGGRCSIKVDRAEGWGREVVERETALSKHKPPVKMVRENFHPSRAVSSEWKKQLLKAKRSCGDWGVVEEENEGAWEGKRRKESGDAAWDCLLEKDSSERMYTYLSVCEIAHLDFIESLILGTTAWKVNSNKEFERALGDFHSAQAMGMGGHYSLFCPLTGSYRFLLGLNLVIAGSMNDEWKKKTAVDDWHFVGNNEWV